MKAGFDLCRSVSHGNDYGYKRIIRKRGKTFLLQETLTEQIIQEQLNLIRMRTVNQRRKFVQRNEVIRGQAFENRSPGPMKHYGFQRESKY